MDLLEKPLIAWSMLNVLEFSGLVVLCFFIYQIVKMVLIAAVEARKRKGE